MPKRKTATKKKASKRPAKSTTVTTMTTTKATRTTTMKNPLQRRHPEWDDDDWRMYSYFQNDVGLSDEDAESETERYHFGSHMQDKSVNPLASNPFTLGKTDRAVIRAFTEQRSASSKKLKTDGQRLDIIGMGGQRAAEWRDGKIHFNDLGSRSGQTVQNAVRKEAPKNDLFNGRGWNPQSKERRAFLQARKKEREGIPRPKFKLGDMVEDTDGSREGKVDFVGSYDAFLGGYQYKVLEADGTRNYWNETSMREVSRNPGHDHMACGDLSQKRCDQLNDVYESSRKRYGKRRSAQIARGVVREQVARDKRKRSRRHNPQWIRVPSEWLRPGMIVKAPKTVGHLTWKRAWGPGTPTAPDRLLVVKWDDETGASELAAIKTDGKPGAYVDFNTNDYPNIWLVEADSIPDLDDAAKQQGQYPPDYEGNPMRTMILVDREERAFQKNPAKGSGKAPTFTKVGDRVYVGRGLVHGEDVYGKPRAWSVDFRIDGRDGPFYRVDKHTLGPWEAIDGGEQHAPRTLPAARALVAEWIAAASKQGTLTPRLDRAANPALPRAKNPSSRVARMGSRIGSA